MHLRWDAIRHTRDGGLLKCEYNRREKGMKNRSSSGGIEEDGEEEQDERERDKR